MTAVGPVPTWDGLRGVPALGGDDVHLWLVELDVEAVELARLRELLSPSEQDREDAFRFELHRARYAVGRGRLRELLAAYTSGEPARIELREGPSGKPELADADLRFNVSHCEGLALCAVARREVGVDLELVERSRPLRWPGIAARFFHPNEQALLDGWVVFLRVWTLKEACLKALGSGLRTDPRTFSVAGVLGGDDETVVVGGEEWRCSEVSPPWVSPGRGTVSALAVATAPRAGAARADRARS
jgi:4'-phosphopantetheinyl transferase